MPHSLPDIYIHADKATISLQGASEAGIAFLAGRYTLVRGTIAVIPVEAAEEAFAAMDAVGLHSRS